MFKANGSNNENDCKMTVKMNKKNEILTMLITLKKKRKKKQKRKEKVTATKVTF